MTMLNLTHDGTTVPGEPIPVPPEVDPHRAGLRAQAALIIGTREVGEGSTWGRHQEAPLDKLDAVYWQAYRAAQRRNSGAT
jgi:hypothetical protein